jgi:hypothetical protein
VLRDGGLVVIGYDPDRPVPYEQKGAKEARDDLCCGVYNILAGVPNNINPVLLPRYAKVKESGAARARRSSSRGSSTAMASPILYTPSHRGGPPSTGMDRHSSADHSKS